MDLYKAMCVNYCLNDLREPNGRAKERAYSVLPLSHKQAVFIRIIKVALFKRLKAALFIIYYLLFGHCCYFGLVDVLF